MSMHVDRWRPSATIETLQLRSHYLERIRAYFRNQGVLEVDTPILSQFGATDINIDAWQTEQGFRLHTSPELSMKRLLASGSGDIYQLCRVFRQDPASQRHNAEFSLLEWYRLAMTEADLMEDVLHLLQSLLMTGHVLPPAQCFSYCRLFKANQLPHPVHSSVSALRQACVDRLSAKATDWSREDCLDALMSLVVEPNLPANALTFVCHYPAAQAALAELIETEDGLMARRFELYWGSMELANGYFELTDVNEQTQRFLKENQLRVSLGKPPIAVDERFLQAMQAGLPVCSGVALGVDRLLMCLMKKNHINQVMAFPFDRA